MTYLATMWGPAPRGGGAPGPTLQRCPSFGAPLSGLGYYGVLCTRLWACNGRCSACYGRQCELASWALRMLYIRYWTLATNHRVNGHCDAFMRAAGTCGQILAHCRRAPEASAKMWAHAGRGVFEVCYRWYPPAVAQALQTQVFPHRHTVSVRAVSGL